MNELMEALLMDRSLLEPQVKNRWIPGWERLIWGSCHDKLAMGRKEPESSDTCDSFLLKWLRADF